MIFVIYLMSVADSLSIALSILVIMLVIIICILVGGVVSSSFDDDDDEVKKVIRYIKILSYVLIIIMTINCLIPGSKTIASMFLLPKIAKNEQIQQLPDKTLTLLNAKLDEWIKDI